jgi:hypothetical protein
MKMKKITLRIIRMINRVTQKTAKDLSFPAKQPLIKPSRIPLDKFSLTFFTDAIMTKVLFLLLTIG